ncbi:hypothetical protein L6R29_13935 [Myxococcota bacterium]|nr:hypothetical protein [Myxococcota bacterium]
MAKQKKQSKGAEESTPFDELMKHLADRYGRELVTYLGGLSEVERCESVGGEVEITHRLTDRVFRVKAKLSPEGEQEEFLVHLEFESSYNKWMGQRLGTYGWHLCERENLPVMHLVWYVSEETPSYWPLGEWQREREEEMWIGGRLVGLVCWREIWFSGKYKAEDFVKEAPAYLLPFAALMEGAERPFIKRLAEAIMKSDVSEQHKQDLLLMASFLFARFFGVQIVQEEIKMSLLEPNPLVEYFMQRGQEKGRQEGRQEIIEKMLGQGLPPQVVANFTGLSVEEVEEIKEARREKTQSKQRVVLRMLERGFSVEEIVDVTEMKREEIERIQEQTSSKGMPEGEG